MCTTSFKLLEENHIIGLKTSIPVGFDYVVVVDKVAQFTKMKKV